MCQPALLTHEGNIFSQIMSCFGDIYRSTGLPDLNASGSFFCGYQNNNCIHPERQMLNRKEESENRLQKNS